VALSGPMAEIKLDDAQLQEALQAAILNAIGTAGREQIIKEAVAYLTRQDNSYGRSTSALSRIVNIAAEQIARTVLEKKFADDAEFQAQVESLYSDALKKLFDVENREKLISRMAEVMGRALSER